MTNGDFIRTQGNEELIKIFDIITKKKCLECPCKNICSTESVESCDKAIEKWLEEEIFCRIIIKDKNTGEKWYDADISAENARNIIKACREAEITKTSIFYKSIS